MAPSFTRHGVDAERRRRVLVLAHRDQPSAEARMLDRVHDQQRGRDQRQQHPIEGRRGSGTGTTSGRRSSLTSVPTPAPVIGATLAMMRSTSAKASVTSAKYEPCRPERNARQPIAAPTQRAGRDAEHERGPGVDAVADLQDRGRIGAGAEERGMPEGILPAIAAEHVPALPDQRDQQRDDQEVEHGVRGDDQRHRGEHRDARCAIADEAARSCGALRTARAGGTAAPG